MPIPILNAFVAMRPRLRAVERIEDRDTLAGWGMTAFDEQGRASFWRELEKQAGIQRAKPSRAALQQIGIRVIDDA